MYEKDGAKYFILDSHLAYWDASPPNQANRYGEGYIKCFYDYHRHLSPESEQWPLEKFERLTEATFMEKVFDEGYVDLGILQTVTLNDFFVEGFTTVARHGALAERYPGRLIVNGTFDPRDGAPGLRRLEAEVARYNLTGLKLYTAAWHGSSKGYKLSDPWAYRYLEVAQELGVRNVHVHKGPTIYPLNQDAFSVADVDEAATDFPGLNFVVEHVGIPRVDDFCWIASQEPNVYGGLAVVLAFLHRRPLYFAKVLAELLFFLGEDRITFGSDFAIWHPRWLIEEFVDFTMPEEVVAEYDVTLTDECKRKILGLNAARLYGIEVPAELQVAPPPVDGDAPSNPDPARAVADSVDGTA